MHTKLLVFHVCIIFTHSLGLHSYTCCICALFIFMHSLQQCNRLVCVNYCRIDNLDERDKHVLLAGSGLDAELFI